MRVLLTEDDKILAQSIASILKPLYVVDLTYNTTQCWETILELDYDLIILDINLGNIKAAGIELCKKIRSEEINTPILLLTGYRSPEYITAGLDAGADDFLSKPFDPNELKARLRALLRRRDNFNQDTYKLGNLKLNLTNRTVTYKDKIINLSRQEFLLLEYLMSHPNIVVSREIIMEHAWDQISSLATNTVDVYVNRLRKKIGQQEGFLIQTVNGLGYKLST